MNYEAIVDEMKRALAFSNRAEAERALAEFLEILGQLLDPRAEVVLMARLPQDMRPVLGPEQVEVFDLDAFVGRVSEHMQLDVAIANRIVRVAACAFSARSTTRRSPS